MNVIRGIDIRKYANDIAKEFFRKGIHICTAFVPLFLKFAYVPVLVLLSLVLCLYIICEIMRMKGKNVPIISAITQAAARKRDNNKFVLGPVTLALGVLITAIAFPLEYAKIGIYALAFGDGLASLAGKLLGHIKIPFTRGKTVVGSLTCFVAIFITTFICHKSCQLALIIAFVGMIIELFPLKDLDNLYIPIILAGLSWLLSI